MTAGNAVDRRPAPTRPAAPASPRPAEEPLRRHEALVSVRLGPSAPGSHLVEYLRHEPCAVDAWWIAAAVDARVRLSADSMTVLHRAVADLRRRAGVEVAVANYILRALDLTTPADPRTGRTPPGVGGVRRMSRPPVAPADRGGSRPLVRREQALRRAVRAGPPRRRAVWTPSPRLGLRADLAARHPDLAVAGRV